MKIGTIISSLYGRWRPSCNANTTAPFGDGHTNAYYLIKSGGGYVIVSKVNFKIVSTGDNTLAAVYSRAEGTAESICHGGINPRSLVVAFHFSMEHHPANEEWALPQIYPAVEPALSATLFKGQ